MAPLSSGLRLVDRQSQQVRFSFDDILITAVAGEMLATALLAHGIRALGRNPVDGTPRGLFCAMGVCQECVLVVDGTMVEACRTRVRDGMVVRRGGTMHDLIIIGAGPAGASAAIEAAALGLRTLLLDEQFAAGGQVWRAPTAAVPTVPASNASLPAAVFDEPADTEGARLRARLHASNVICAFDRRVWLVEHGFTVSALGPDGPETFQAPCLIVAIGAQERHVPVPGWELPGVIGLAAATVLLKAEQVLPGRRVVVAGVGPLLALVAAEIVRVGATVAAVIDANRRRDWLRRPAALMSRPGLAARGAGWVARLAVGGVPHLSGHTLRRIEGTETVTHAVAGPVDDDMAPCGGRERVFECDAVCCGFGLQPATDITRLLGAVHAYLPALGGWSPVTTDEQATSVRRLYSCGDGAGVLGAAAAPLRGRIAAIVAARDLGHVTPAKATTLLGPLFRALHNAARFGGAMTALGTPRAGVVAAITAETTVCRCERLSRRELDAAITQGAVTLNDLKSATRCGMGPCAGRLCEDAAARLIAAQTGRTRDDIGQATARPPLRPVPLQALAGHFDYDSLPVGEPAPL